ncbi:hypothetical protein KIN38_05315 [Vibrio sp. B511a]|nr:hypothetical protein [Vibrio alginolyticus]MBS9982299.1 hypothetical protein [Vibrio alginolyticus]MDK9732153.1 hypothetical protein [Vibrio sp. B511a]
MGPPPLWDLAERDIAGFNYSEAIKQHQGQWDAEKLDAFFWRHHRSLLRAQTWSFPA